MNDIAHTELRLASGETVKLWPDPAPHDRVYYRHAVRGDRGYLVLRADKPEIRLDLPRIEAYEKLTADWTREAKAPPMAPMQVAQILYAADVKLCFFLGIHNLPEWDRLRDEERIRFMKHGPKTDSSPGEIRTRQFALLYAFYSELLG